MQGTLSTTSFKFEVITLDPSGRVIHRARAEAKGFQEIINPSTRLEMVQIPSGTFEMGSPQTELDRVDDEGPQQSLTLPDFFMSRSPVTQSQWKANANKVQIFEKVEGGYHEHNYAQEQGFEILLEDYKQFINELQQKHPNATDEAAIAKIIAVEYQEVKRLQPQRWQNFLSFKRLLNGGKKAIVKGGEHFTEHNFWGKIGVALLEGVMEAPS